MTVEIFNLIDNRDTSLEEKYITDLFNTVDDNLKKFQVIFVTNEQIHKMNREYRGKDRPTDVLSFIDDTDDETYGDVFISLEKVLEQAKEFQHSYQRELCFLATHGYLHLKGYDHIIKEEEIEMMSLTEEILKKANLEREFYDWSKEK